MGSRRADVRRYIRELEGKGYRVEHGAKHWSVYDGDVYVTQLPKTPSDFRWVGNARTDLKRYETGLKRLDRTAVQVADTEPGQRERTRRRHRHRPAAPKTPLAHGFDFPEFEMPVSGFTPDTEVEQAIARNTEEWLRNRREAYTQWAANRMCDGCLEESGDETRIIKLQGTRQQQIEFYAGLANWLTLLGGKRKYAAMRPGEAAMLAGRKMETAQLCPDCANLMGWGTSATWGDIARLIRKWDGSEVFKSGALKITVNVAVLPLTRVTIPDAFRRAGNENEK